MCMIYVHHVVVSQCFQTVSSGAQVRKPGSLVVLTKGKRFRVLGLRMLSFRVVVADRAVEAQIWSLV